MKPARDLLRVGVLAQIVTLVLAAVARLHAWPELFVGGVLLPISNDASYHVRRILGLVDHLRYPGLFDPLLDWPRGAATHWSPGFDLIAAGVAILCGGLGNPHRTAQVAAALPVVYGLAAVAVVGGLAMRVVPRGDPLLWATAALFVALGPQSVCVSQAGFVDHHVTEILFTALLWWWTVAGTERAETHGDLRARLRFEAAGALLVTASVWVQSVGLLYVGVATAALVVLQIVRRSPAGEPGPAHPWIGTGGPALAAGAALLALLYAPAVREHGHAWAYEFPSYFQPTLLALGAAAVALAGVLGGSIRRGGARPAGVALRLAGGLLGLLAAATAVFALVPAARGALEGLLQLAASKGPDLSRIDELQPLLGAPGAPDGSRWDRIEGYFGWTGAAAIVLLPLGLWALSRAGRDEEADATSGPAARERFAGACVWTLALLGLSLAQNRWSRALVVPVAVVCAVGLQVLVGQVLRIVEQRPATARPGDGAPAPTGEPPAEPSAPSPRRAAMAAFAAALVLLLAPEPAHAVAPAPVHDTAVMEAGLYLRGLGREPTPGQRSGLLAPWTAGFQLLHVSGLPLLSTGHAWLVGEDGYRLERAAWGSTPEALWSLMDERDLGFVVAGANNLVSVKKADGTTVSLRDRPGGEHIDWDYFKAAPLGVMVLGGTALPELGVRHLEQLCPRYAGTDFAALELPLPRLWVFERVRGALLEGHAVPGSRIVAELLLKHAAGLVSYFAFTDADAAGAFSIRFPVPTRMAGTTLKSGRVLRIKRQGAAVTEMDLPEAAVLSGAHVPVPPAADTVAP